MKLCPRCELNLIENIDSCCEVCLNQKLSSQNRNIAVGKNILQLIFLKNLLLQIKSTFIVVKRGLKPSTRKVKI